MTTRELPRYGEVYYKGILHIVKWADVSFLCEPTRAWGNGDHVRYIGSTETESPYCKNCMRVVIERTM